jgi:serine/threonine-protein kinase
MVKEPLQAPQDPFTTSLTGRRLGRYEVLTRLASGGMAGVYVARALGVAGFERLFAIKVLHPHLAHEEEFITMFLDEARLAARIHHPNVVATIDISDTSGAGYYLVMDYIEGDHLGALLQHAFKAGARLPAPVALRVVVDALNGLAAAHNLVDETGRLMNLVHRDVSPHNIMVSTDGISRLSDFGVAKAEVRLSTTREGQFKGKLAYMAPEHASTGEATQRSDLFSTAIILWECLTGTRLFRAENHAATLNKICLEPVPMPSTVDPELAVFDPILERGLARDPADRYESAEEFAETIEEHAHALGGLATHRVVGQLVRDYAAEKLARESDLIRTAIAEMSASGPVEVVDDGGAQTTSARPGPRSGRAPAVDASEAPAPPRRSAGLWIAVAVVALCVALAAAFWLGAHGDARGPATQPTAGPAPEPAVPAAAEPVAPAPAPDSPPTTPSGAAGTGEARQAGEGPAAGTEGAPDTAAGPSGAGEPAKATRTGGEARAARGERPAPTRESPKPQKQGKRRGADDLILNPYR